MPVGICDCFGSWEEKERLNPSVTLTRNEQRTGSSGGRKEKKKAAGRQRRKKRKDGGTTTKGKP